jgi:hypothetical protein
MTINAANPIYQKVTLDEYKNKTQKILDDLNTGKMWLNDKCETVKKDGKIIRWLKAILSVILPVNLYGSIKASKVAMSIFEFAKTNSEHLNDDDAYDQRLAILNKLGELTRGKYSKKIEMASNAITGLVVSDEEDSDSRTESADEAASI